MKKFILSSVLVVSFVVGSVSAEKIQITGDNVNLRSASLADAEVVSQANEGDVLVSAGKEGEWLKVVPPQNVNLWVYGELVRDGVVAVSKLRVRGGQGINYKSVGSLKKGEKVTIRGQEGDWLKIAPPEGTYLWVSAKYAKKVKDEPKPKPEKTVRPDKPKPVVKPVVKKPPMPQGSVPVVRPDPVPVSVKPSVAVVPKYSDYNQKFIPSNKISEEMAKIIERLRPESGTGRVVKYKGSLRKSSLVWHRPSKYRLIMSDERGRSYTICYVLSDEDTLQSFEGKQLVVSGREYWADGVRYSVVIPEKILTQD